MAFRRACLIWSKNTKWYKISKSENVQNRQIVSNGKKTTNPDLSASRKSSNLKKRKYSRGNAVTGLSEDEVFSDLSSSGMSSDDDHDIDDNSEDDFEETMDGNVQVTEKENGLFEDARFSLNHQLGKL